jgi:hypothetical protein
VWLKRGKNNDEGSYMFLSTYFVNLGVKLSRSVRIHCVKVMSSSRRKFTCAEDELIKRGVLEQKDPRYPDWNVVAAQIEGKNSRQVRERYQHYLGPGLSSEPWTPDEDLKLMSLYGMYGKGNWLAISQRMPGRSNAAVKNRWNNRARTRMQCMLFPDEISDGEVDQRDGGPIYFGSCEEE